jgi:hypothetical protein
MHLAADIFSLPPPDPCFLCRAGWHRDYNFIAPFVDIIPDDHRPRKMTERFDKTGQSFFRNGKPGYDIFCRHASDTPPYQFVDLLCDGLTVLFCDIDKPECIHDPVMPEQEFKILAFIGVIHCIKNFKIHATHAGSP